MIIFFSHWEGKAGNEINFANTYWYVFGKRLLNIRKMKSYSQDQLSSASGVSVPTLVKIESGRGNPSFETIVALAVALEVHPAYLFFNNVNTNPDLEHVCTNIIHCLENLSEEKNIMSDFEDELEAIRDAFKSIAAKQLEKGKPSLAFLDK